MGNDNFLERQKNLMDGKLKIYFSDKQNLSALKEDISEEDINCLDEKDKIYMKDFPELKTFFEQKLEKFKNEKKICDLSESLMSYQNQINELSKKEMKNREEYEKREKNQKEELLKMLSNHQRELDSIQKKAYEQVQKQQEQSEKTFRLYIENMEKKYKEEKDEEKKRQILEEKKKAEELEEKKKKCQKELNDKMESISSFDIDALIKSFTLNEDNFCKEDISKFDINKINKLIIDMVKEEKIVDYTFHQLNLVMEEIKDKIKDVEHLNIILVGPSGVGKSTLINAILELETQAVTGFGNPQTQNIEFHTSEKIPFLRLADSKGIEKNKTSGVDAIYNSIKDFIKKQIETRDPDKYIHCIWYCWTGTRLEETEVQILKKLSEQYTLQTLPIIIVYTNAIDPDQIGSAKKYIIDELKLKNEFINILSVEKKINVASQVIKIPPSNLDKLKEISIKSAMSAINSSCYEGLLEDLKIKIKEKIADLSEKLMLKINSQKKEVAEIIKNCKLEDFVNTNTLIFLNIFYKFLFLSPNAYIEKLENPEVILGNSKYPISEYLILRVKDFFIEYFRECLKNFEKNIYEILDNESKKIANKVYTMQLEYIAKYEKLLDLQTNIELENIIKKNIYEKLYQEAKSAALNNYFIFLSEKIIQKLGEFFDEFYKKGMSHPKFRESANTFIKIPFDKIEQKIKEYEKNKKEQNEQNEKNEQNEQNVQEAPAPIETNDFKQTVQSDVEALFSTI